MKNVFLVKSPLQLLNAFEAKYHFKLNDEDCFLVLVVDKKNYSQMINLASRRERWGGVVVLDEVPLISFRSGLDRIMVDKGFKVSSFFESSFFRIWKINNIAKYFSNIDMLFIGDNYNAIMRHFINVTKNKKIVLLDDGVGSIYMSQIRSGSTDLVSNVKLKNRIKLSLKRFVQGLKDQQADRVCFFSAYDLSLPKGDVLINNEYTYLKEMSRAVELEDVVYFVGSPLSESGLMNEDQYISQVRDVANYFKGNQLVYVSHRRESKEKLDAMSQEMNLKICEFDFPIEYQITMIGPRPKVMVSFISSALENLRLIMGDQMEIMAFRLKKGTYKQRERLDSIYSYYEKNSSDHFKLISLDE